MREEMEGNLCRCTGYHNIVKAILAAAPIMRRARAERSTPDGDVSGTLSSAAGSRRCVAPLHADAEDGSYLSGGHTLLPAMKQRLAHPSDLIDLTALPELRGISLKNDVLSIGATTPHAEVANSALVRSGHSGFGRSGGFDRRSPRAQSRHHRRFRRQQRPCRGLSGRGSWTRRDCHHRPPQYRGRRLFCIAL